MKLSIFTTITNPRERQDPYHKAIESYLDLADEVVVVYGNKNDIVCLYEGYGRRKNIDTDEHLIGIYRKWPEDFKWEFIGKQFQRGYNACSGDWVIRADIDYIFHENEMKKIRRKLESFNGPAASFWKHQFILVDRYNLKSRPVLAVNKKKFGNRITFNGGGDLCQVALDGKTLTNEDVPEVRASVYNYDFCFKDEGTVKKDFYRFAKARYNYNKENWGYRSKESALKFFKNMMVGRYKAKEWEIVPIDFHPKYIREKIINIKLKQFGYDGFGLLEKITYV